MIEKAKASSTFCIYPFSHLATKTDGTFRLCCRSDSLGHVQEHSLPEIWNGEKIKNVRRKLLNNERPQECERCWFVEDLGVRSMRQRALKNGGENSRWNIFSPMLNSCSSAGEMSSLPGSVELKINNLCNLKCTMCSPVDSVLWAKEWPEISDLIKDYDIDTYMAADRNNIIDKPMLAHFENSPTWWNNFEDIIDHLKIVEFAGGEPLIDPTHYKILNMLERRASHIQLKYSTNLTNILFRGQSITDFWKNYASVKVYASVDGIHDVYEYIRSGGTFKKVDQNLNTIRDSKNFQLDDLAIACTIQIYNTFQLLDIVNYFMPRNITFHTHYVTYPAFLNIQVLPEKIKAILTDQAERWMRRVPKNENDEYQITRTKKHIQDFIQFLNGRDQAHLLPAFREFTNRMDKIRKTNAKKISPYLAEILAEPSSFISLGG